jgi:hypothetical protein
VPHRDADPVGPLQVIDHDNDRRYRAKPIHQHQHPLCGCLDRASGEQQAAGALAAQQRRDLPSLAVR